MVHKNCPYCKTLWENCTCDKPFDLTQIPKPLVDGLARSMFWDIKKFFADPKNQMGFKKWLQEKEVKSEV